MSILLRPQIVDDLRFELAWTAFSSVLRYAALTKKNFVVPPAGPQAATHLTLIGRLPFQVCGPIREAVASLVEPTASHYVYPSDTLHVTIQNLDILNGADRPDWLLEKLSVLVGSCPPINMIAAGFGVSPNSVFVQIFPIDHTLTSLRHEIRGLIRAACWPERSADLSSHLSHRLFRNIAFANVIRFSGPVTPTLLHGIKRFRRHVFGAFVLEALELVRTDRLLSARGTQVRERISLRGSTSTESIEAIDKSVVHIKSC